jgi:hypothetical protein
MVLQRIAKGLPLYQIILVYLYAPLMTRNAIICAMIAMKLVYNNAQLIRIDAMGSVRIVYIRSFGNIFCISIEINLFNLIT